MPQIGHTYIILIIGGSESGKGNSLFRLISQKPDIDEIYLYAKDPCEVLINKRESTSLKHFKNFKAFTEYSNYMHSIYKNIEEFNPNKKNVNY